MTISSSSAPWPLPEACTSMPSSSYRMTPCMSMEPASEPSVPLLIAKEKVSASWRAPMTAG